MKITTNKINVFIHVDKFPGSSPEQVNTSKELPSFSGGEPGPSKEPALVPSCPPANPAVSRTHTIKLILRETQTGLRDITAFISG
ncbi:hypothetical protein GN956_G15212 [Arapaima gigas]